AKKEAEIKAAATQTAYNQLVASAATARPVAYSTTYLASDAIKANATALGNYKLTFYDPCVECNGNNLALTATGTTLTEGRTIAVDPSVIPLGSRVFIEGYGVFIAEDTGGAIKGNKIDIAVSTHERANELGVQYANVYLLK
ncbi:MAG: 3D domain-containing protein, partial [Agathobaculum butyriciproducens]